MMIRRFRHPFSAENRVWYAEYDGRFVCREFWITKTGTIVAPYDLPFSDVEDVNDVPPHRNAEELPLRDFQVVWQTHAWPRLRAILTEHNRAKPRALPIVKHLHTHMTDDEGEYGEGEWYVEFADGIARRQFEVYPHRVLVAPYDIGLSESLDSLMEEETENRLREIPAADFQRLWESKAEPRLMAIGQRQT